MKYIKWVKITLLLIAFSLALTSPAAGVLTNIQKGETVFLGEEGLVLANNVFYSSGGVYDEQLAYFAGSNPATDSPEYVIRPKKNDFYVVPSIFSNRPGIWHSYPNGSKNSYSSINVVRPYLGLRLWAFRSGGASFDITNGKIVRGEALDFRIDSNLYPIFQRTGVAAGDNGVDIIVKNQVGASISSLVDCTGNPVSIVNIHPTNQQFFLPAGIVACVWDTGNDQYKSVSYTIWAECNVNGMKDNLGSIQGQTVTPSLSSLRKTPTPTETQATQPTTATSIVTGSSTSTPELTQEQTVSTEIPVQTEADITPQATSESTQTAKKNPYESQIPQTPLIPFVVIISVVSAVLITAILSKKK